MAALSHGAGVLRAILANEDLMPKQRHQNPKILQNRDGSFYIRPYVDLINEAGDVERRKQTIVLGPAEIGKRKAITKRNEVMTTVNRSDYVLRSQIRFGDMLDRFDSAHIRTLGYAAQCKYRNLIKKHIRPAFCDLQMFEMTTLRIQEWLDSRKLSPSTRKDLRNIISGVFTRAIAWGIHREANPVSLVRVRGGLVREKRKLTDEQTRAFLAKLPWALRVMCCTGLFCTLRVSEMLGLQEKHLDFEHRIIKIRQRYYRGDTGRTKTNTSERDVAMGYLADDLRGLCAGDPERYVFQVETKPLWGRKTKICRDDRDLNQHFLRPAAKLLGFYWVGFGFHALRREAITSIGSVAGLSQAMRAAGHGTADMSLLYTLREQEEQDLAIKQHQERILGKAARGIN